MRLTHAGIATIVILFVPLAAAPDIPELENYHQLCVPEATREGAPPHLAKMTCDCLELLLAEVTPVPETVDALWKFTRDKRADCFRESIEKQRERDLEE